MRPISIAILACLALSACGSSHKTVVVNPPPNTTTVVDPPPGSTTVVDSNGHTHVITNNDHHDRRNDRY